MRINQFVARSSGLSRRAADRAILDKRVTIDGQLAGLGINVPAAARVQLDGQPLALPSVITTLMLNKPVGYVCSRVGQGSQTIYELLPSQHQQLKAIGRLDKDSSGLILLTNDGSLANHLTHPRYAKQKIYQVSLDKPLTPAHKQELERGVKIDDYISQLDLSAPDDQVSGTDSRNWKVALKQGRNRQIRRTFEALGYSVRRLHRTQFGDYSLGQLEPGQWRDAS